MAILSYSVHRGQSCGWALPERQMATGAVGGQSARESRVWRIICRGLGDELRWKVDGNSNANQFIATHPLPMAIRSKMWKSNLL